MSLPIVIFHEGNDTYIKYAILSAEKYNDEVYLLGDESNEDFCKKWINAADLDSEAYHVFEKRFVCLSSHPYWYELVVMKRYFVISQFLKASGYKRCVMLDSDVLVYTDFSKLKELENCGVAMYVDMKTGCCVPGVFYCTESALNDFIDFICDIYDNNVSLLREMYKTQKNRGLTDGIGEMVLLYLWSKERNDILDWRMVDNYIVDNNMYIPRQREENSIRMDKIFKVKKIVFKRGTPYCYDLIDRKWKPVVALHCSGCARIFMKDLYLQRGYIKRLCTKIWSSRKILRYLFPTDLVPRNSKIAIWGGGKVGKSYYRQLRISRYAKVCVWVDKNWKDVKNKKIVSPYELRNAEIDYIVIAIVSKQVAIEEIMEEIKKMNLDNVQIIWRKP